MAPRCELGAFFFVAPDVSLPGLPEAVELGEHRHQGAGVGSGDPYREAVRPRHTNVAFEVVHSGVPCRVRVCQRVISERMNGPGPGLHRGYAGTARCCTANIAMNGSRGMTTRRPTLIAGIVP